MVNLLIVDDEVLTVEILESEIPWLALGVSHVHHAFSMKQACEVMNKEKIDILICDIEMPQGDGLSLVEWIQSEQMDPITIFLTGHANFDYAARAIKLHSMDYLLKPIRFERLSEVVSQAVSEVEKRRSFKTIAHHGERWLANQSRLIGQFWHDILRSVVSSEPSELERVAHMRKLPAETLVSRILVLFAIKDQPSGDQQWKEWDLDFALKNIIYEVMDEPDAVPVSIDDRHILVLLPAVTTTDSTVETRSLYICRLAAQHLSLSIGGCIGPVCSPSEAVMVYSSLSELEEQHVTNDVRILHLKHDVIAPVAYEQPDMKEWEALIYACKENELVEKVQTWLDSRAKLSQLDGRSLRRFQQDFLQMVYAALRQHELSAHLLFQDNEGRKLQDRAAETLPDMMRFVAHTVNHAISHAKADRQSDSVVERVKSFVRDHVDTIHSREDLIRVVNLNPEYLSRLFKRQTGMSVTAYIQQEKMQMARKLLLDPSLSISDVATRIGYVNFAYFSYLFKKMEGESPQQWRKQHTS